VSDVTHRTAPPPMMPIHTAALPSVIEHDAVPPR